MKQILKRFKYKREAIFTHYRMRTLRKNTAVQIFLYTHSIIKQTKKLFIKFKQQIIKNIPNTITINKPTAASSIMHKFFEKITYLMSDFLNIN